MIFFQCNFILSYFNTLISYVGNITILYTQKIKYYQAYIYSISIVLGTGTTT